MPVAIIRLRLLKEEESALIVRREAVLEIAETLVNSNLAPSSEAWLKRVLENSGPEMLGAAGIFNLRSGKNLPAWGGGFKNDDGFVGSTSVNSGGKTSGTGTDNGDVIN